jgi:hypothetical protein
LGKCRKRATSHDCLPGWQNSHSSLTSNVSLGHLSSDDRLGLFLHPSYSIRIEIVPSFRGIKLLALEIHVKCARIRVFEHPSRSTTLSCTHPSRGVVVFAHSAVQDLGGAKTCCPLKSSLGICAPPLTENLTSLFQSSPATSGSAPQRSRGNSDKSCLAAWT